ncbi:hypothetical protein EJ06DRAFT_176971 [Trichodelitschia bisporula]|uniref:Uncharacterized protein n=1 Tax=Trichodelitschia bisporula TaxID=703511 RepID=A0A6G1HLK0_9PEZI|nr:hypothetical protein EJ06DRAFT_176971 [Trichodelitschia bisporula]
MSFQRVASVAFHRAHRLGSLALAASRASRSGGVETRGGEAAKCGGTGTRDGRLPSAHPTSRPPESVAKRRTACNFPPAHVLVSGFWSCESYVRMAGKFTRAGRASSREGLDSLRVRGEPMTWLAGFAAFGGSDGVHALAMHPAAGPVDSHMLTLRIRVGMQRLGMVRMMSLPIRWRREEVAPCPRASSAASRDSTMEA